MTTDELARIYIPAQIYGGTFGLFSLRHLVTVGDGGAIWEWFKRQMGNRVIPISMYESGAVMDARRALNLVRILEANGITVYRVGEGTKPEASS